MLVGCISEIRLNLCMRDFHRQPDTLTIVLYVNTLSILVYIQSFHHLLPNPLVPSIVTALRYSLRLSVQGILGMILWP